MTSGAPHLEGSLRRSWEFGRGGAPLIKNEDRGMNLEAFADLHSGYSPSCSPDSTR